MRGLAEEEAPGLHGVDGERTEDLEGPPRHQVDGDMDVIDEAARVVGTVEARFA